MQNKFKKGNENIFYFTYVFTKFFRFCNNKKTLLGPKKMQSGICTSPKMIKIRNYVKNNQIPFVFTQDSMTLLTGDDRTPVCLVVCDSDGNSRLLVGDMNAHRQINPTALQKCQEEIINSKLVILDGNVPADSMKWIFETCNQHNIPGMF